MNDATDYRQRIRRHLPAAPAAFAAPPTGTRGAAVLIPIVERVRPTVLFTLRTSDLASHAGQISFPGGRVDPADASPVATALRETFEETGIGPDWVEVAGALDIYRSASGYAITPVVGFVREGFALRPNAREVAEVFEVPLDVLLDRGRYRRIEAVRDGIARSYFEIEFSGRVIWGATAGMLVELCKMLIDES